MFDELIGKVKELESRLDSASTQRWATVTQASPLRVRFDGDAAALLVTPINLVGNLALNDRVRAELNNGQLYVTDKLGGIDVSGFATTSSLTSGLATKAATSHTHNLSDVNTTSIPTAANLNTYTTQGIYYQGSNAYAAAGSNYPEPYAGLLEVFNAGAGGFIYQRYTVYREFNNRTWTRTYYNSAWSAWANLNNNDITPTTGTNANGTYIRHPEGTQICWNKFSITPSANNPTGKTWTYPAVFTGEPTIQVTADTTVPMDSVKMVSQANATATSATIYVYRVNNTGTYMNMTAFGRWY